MGGADQQESNEIEKKETDMTFDLFLLLTYLLLLPMIGMLLEANRRVCKRSWPEQAHTFRLAINDAFKLKWRIWIYTLAIIGVNFLILLVKPESFEGANKLETLIVVPILLLWITSSIFLLVAIWSTGLSIVEAMKPHEKSFPEPGLHLVKK